MRLTLFEDGRTIETHRITGLHKAHSKLYTDSEAPNVTVPIELDANGVVNIGRAEAEFKTMGKPRVDKKNKKTLPPKREKKKITLNDDAEYSYPVPMSRRERLDARK